MRVLVCGDRNWTNHSIIRSRLELLPSSITTVLHGAARGADRMAGHIAESLGMKIESYPADWERYGKAAGVIRNQEMLDACPDLVIAFHSDLSKSKGTADMVRRARKAGIPVEVIGI